MAKLPIRTVPDPLLLKTSVAVESVDDRLRQLMADMLETMYAAEGIGLAAPQIGVLERVIVVDVEQKEGMPGQPLRMANPEILQVSEERAIGTEGCLSIPDQRAEVERHARVRVGYLDEQGARQVLDADGLLAVCLQHEIDHLNGVLFIDHISKFKRDTILRRMRRRAREAAEG